jgi:hypothetical protein
MRKAEVSLRLPLNLIEAIKRDAKQSDTNVNSCVESALLQHYSIDMCDGNEQAAKLYAEIKAGGDKKLIEILLNKKS